MSSRIFAPSFSRTIEEFEQDAVRVAGVLGEQGIRPGDRVMLKAGNSVGYLATLYAVMHLGASVVLVDQMETAERADRISGQAGVKLTIADAEAPLTGTGPSVFVDELVDAAAGRSAGPLLSFDDWAQQPDGLIMCTSGSTGLPKGIVKCGGRFLKNLERNADQIGHRESDVLMPLLPFPHQYGLSMVLIAWLRRASLVVAPHRRIDHALQMVAETGATVMDATPSTYRSMLNILRKRTVLQPTLDCVRMFCVGAAPLDQSLVKEYLAELDRPLLDSYGTTELGNVSFATVDNPNACGRVMPGINVRIVDDEGAHLTTDEIGEVEIESPDMMTGYLTDSGVMEPATQGWWPTGDFGYLDEHENLIVIGRKFAVSRMGFTLYPEVIEHTATAAGCATKIVALPDERKGSHLVFFVQDDQARDSKYWRDRLCEVLAPYEQPNRVVVVDSFPLNTNGKSDTHELEKMALAVQCGELLSA
ncbi:MAG: acyl--CoA ligase [Amycolatopsis sp.]|uniref:class I adenylate-forming enzyme family protein n=1 Tax=Amycolatopsis sp. TaxID=37632 RepID=UPI00261CF5F2|nr:class I adenylate-forming enzyme family protein [Amycolatopsis sp.]MCU1686847.1 acyl--CoA ligase [Amycolatopsis sp.]